jgi:hypothetical protein
MVLYNVHNTLPLNSIMTHINFPHISTTCYFEIKFYIILPLLLGLPRGLIPAGFPTKICVFLSSLPWVVRAPSTSFSLILSC